MSARFAWARFSQSGQPDQPGQQPSKQHRSRRASRRQLTGQRFTGRGEALEERSLLAVDAVLHADTFSMRQNSDPSTLAVLANDSFPVGYVGAGTISAVSYGSAGGQISLSNDAKSIVYRPPADFAGTEQFSYYVDGLYTTTVNVQITSPLRDDAYTINPDGQRHSLDVLSNDRFWTDYTGPRVITAVSVSSGEAQVELAADGKSVWFQPQGWHSGTEQFVYVVDGTFSATVSVHIPATLTEDAYELLQNSSATSLSVLANDQFWNGYDGPKVVTHVESTYSQFNGQSNGTATIAADGKSIQYTPTPGISGYDQLVYVVDDRQESTASIYIIRPVQDDYGQVDTNSTAHAFDVISNDTYWSPKRQAYVDVVNRVTSVVTTTEQGGTAAVSADGRSVLYTPPTDFVGSDTVTYTADGKYEATLRVEVSRPVRDDYLNVYQDIANQGLSVLDNDFLGNGYVGARQITSVSETEQGGTLTLQNGKLLYSPAAGINGDAFTYTVDGQLEARAVIYVTPLAQADYYNAFCPAPNVTRSLNVLNNDHFDKGYQGPGVITSAVVTSGNGSVEIGSNGQMLRYRPASSGYDVVNYIVDSKYETTVSVYNYSHLVADHFVVDQNSASTTMQVLTNDFSENWWNNCSLSSYTGQRQVTEVRPSEHGGTVTIAADGRTVAYTPAADFAGTDSFTYVVDGIMETTVTVEVEQRVRDDEYRVAAGATKSFMVLKNDIFGSDYSGAQRVTHVTASTVGATVAISPDGKGVLYTAPAEFTGVDTLTYTVDGQLKATIDVRPASDSPYPQFDSSDDFRQFLIDDAVQRYEGLFGQTQWNWFWDGNGAPPLFDLGAVENKAPEPAEVRGHSETNVQVAGVDEGDIVEFDSNHVYMLTGNDVVILDAWPAEEISELSRYSIDGDAIAMFLHDDRLTVISQKIEWTNQGRSPVVDYDASTGQLTSDVGGAAFVDKGIAVDGFFPPYYGTATYMTIVTVLDVEDRTQPTMVQRTEMEGQYVASRGIGDYVYVSLTHPAVSSGPQVLYADENRSIGIYETKEEFLARVAENPGDFIADALPNYTSYGADGNVVRAGLLQEPEDIYRPLVDGAMSLVSLVSFNIESTEPGLANTAGVYTNGATEVYASLQHFYIFENGYDEDGNVTRVLQFDWDADSGSVAFTAKGDVPGYMLNQFSADEYQGNLRIATTVTRANRGIWSSTTENDLFVLREDGGVLDFVGSLQNLGVGETARSVRFMGPRAYIVTYRTVDPLFAIDLSDATNPTVAGYLTIPGFSTYAQMIDDSHLITVGRNTPNGWSGPAQVSMYDVSDLAHPRLVDEHTFARFSTTEAAVDHHAFGYYAAHGMLAVPTSRGYVVRRDANGDGYAETSDWVQEYDLEIFRIDVTAAPGSNQGLQLVGEITHDSPVRRSGYIDDKLYSIAEDSVSVVEVAAPNVVVATVDGLRPEPLPPDDLPIPLWMGQLFDLAQHDLASRLSVAPGAVMPVVTEQSGGERQAVVRVEDSYFRYVAAGDGAMLVESDFHFPGAGDDEGWQNPIDALDVNGDGSVAPSDALLIINYLTDTNSGLTRQPVVRQIGENLFWDTSGDGLVSPLDALLVINQVNAQSNLNLDTGSLDPSDPVSLQDIGAVEDFFSHVRESAGDSNLDGIFNSADLVQIFQQGKYEQGLLPDATWQDGDWNGDRRVDSTDLVLAFTYGHYSAAATGEDL